MLKFIQKIFTFLISFFLFGCFEDNDAPKISYYSPPDLTAYVAIEDSTTSGYGARGGKGLLRSIQKVSYPKFIADQFQKVNPALIFNQPLMDGERDEAESGTSTRYRGELIHNLGVANMETKHALDNTLTAQETTEGKIFKFFTSLDNTTQIGDAISRKPTFVMLWLGINDINHPLNSIRILGIKDKIDDSLKENLISNLNTALDIAQASYEGEMRKIMDELVIKGGIQKGAIANHGNPTDSPSIKSVVFYLRGKFKNDQKSSKNLEEIIQAANAKTKDTVNSYNSIIRKLADQYNWACVDIMPKRKSI